MNLKGKLEQACALVINTHSALRPALRDQVYLGADEDEVAKPCVICSAAAGDSEEPAMSGNRMFQVKILVFGQAELEEGDPVEEHNANVAAVFGILKEADDGEEWGQTLAKRLTAAVDEFTVYDEGISDAGEDPEIQGRAYADSLVLDVFCCNADIS